MPHAAWPRALCRWQSLIIALCTHTHTHTHTYFKMAARLLNAIPIRNNNLKAIVGAVLVMGVACAPKYFSKSTYSSSSSSSACRPILTRRRLFMTSPFFRSVSLCVIQSLTSSYIHTIMIRNETGTRVFRLGHARGYPSSARGSGRESILVFGGEDGGKVASAFIVYIVHLFTHSFLDICTRFTKQ